MKRYVVVVVLLGLLGAVAPAFPAGAAAPSRRAAGPLTPTRRDGLVRVLESGRLSQAEYALQRAKSLFRLNEVRKRFNDVVRPNPEEATFLLRDLAVRKGLLSGASRREAERLLARPTDGSADPTGFGYDRTADARWSCTTNVCIHYVTSTNDAPDLTDTNGNGLPDYVDVAKQVFENEVWATEVGLYGYRPPKSDLSSPTNGGDRRIDIYLADVGADRLYGFCTSDDPHLENTSTYPYYDASAYCVVDDDFDPNQYGGTATGLTALRVTAAHEFFHAIQYAYDISEDVWFMENTGTWIEDEVYDAVDDNYQYLGASALSNPHKALDYGDGFFQYGNWIFWRFLSEHFGRSLQGAGIVKESWQQADAAAGGPDRFSLEAVEVAVGHRGESFGDLFAQFGAANFQPQGSYEEGAAYEEVVGAPTLSGKFFLGSSVTSTGTVTKTLDHLSNRFVVFKPGSGASDAARLRVTLNGPGSRTNPRATLLLFKTSGEVVRKSVALDSAGDGRTSVSFSKSTITKVVLVLTNASTRYDCWIAADSPFSCRGFSKDDGKAFAFSAQLLQ